MMPKLLHKKKMKRKTKGKYKFTMYGDEIMQELNLDRHNACSKPGDAQSTLIAILVIERIPVVVKNTVPRVKKF